MGLPAPGSWVICNEPSGTAESHTQPLPKRPVPLASNSALKASKEPHLASMAALRAPLGAVGYGMGRPGPIEGLPGAA